MVLITLNALFAYSTLSFHMLYDNSTSTLFFINQHVHKTFAFLQGSQRLCSVLSDTTDTSWRAFVPSVTDLTTSCVQKASPHEQVAVNLPEVVAIYESLPEQPSERVIHQTFPKHSIAQKVEATSVIVIIADYLMTQGAHSMAVNFNAAHTLIPSCEPLIPEMLKWKLLFDIRG